MSELKTLIAINRNGAFKGLDVSVRQDAGEPTEFVTVCVRSGDGLAIECLTPTQARAVAEALVSAAQLVEDLDE